MATDASKKNKNFSKLFKLDEITIFMVPRTLRNLNPSAYIPQIISIGPLHAKDNHLRAMEKHKVTYMNQLFRRTSDSTGKDLEEVVNECVAEVVQHVKRARECYELGFDKYDNTTFTEMMVTDGCFILELLYRFKYGKGEHDPIFDSLLVTRDIKNDLLLLENQIPFFILEVLFPLTVEKISNNVSGTNSLTDLITSFFEDMNIISDSVLTRPDEELKHSHLLGFIHSCYTPYTARDRHRSSESFPTNTHSATKLYVAGVKFKAQQDEKYLRAVKFTPAPDLVDIGVRKACFELPVLLYINNSTPLLLRNMIAYEQCYPLSRHYITSLAFLMNRLIDNKDDVSFLVRSKVFKHSPGADQDVTNLFNTICKGVVLRDQFHYACEWKQLDEYCNQFWPRTLIWMRDLYESTTWKILTTIAAFILFVLSLLQTIYTVKCCEQNK